LGTISGRAAGTRLAKATYNEPMSERGEVNPDASARPKLTYDDFLLFPDDGKRHELIDGEHHVSPSPDTRHQVILGRLYLEVANWLENHPIGHVFLAPYDVVFSRFDVIGPDLLYVANERAAEIITKLHVEGSPDLVVEIASPGTRKRDEIIKRKLPERADVREYWLVEPDAAVVRVHRRAGGQFAKAVELSARAGSVLTTAPIPGWTLSLPRLFRPL
jgi:Uma2 family endonuclease